MELCEVDAEFLVVGGWAVILYGHVRATDDMDIFVRPTETNSRRVFAALDAFGAPLHAHGVTPEHFANQGDAYRFGIAPLKISVRTPKPSVLSAAVTFSTACSNVVPTSLFSNP